MSRFLASRIARLEAKRRANDLPKVICVVGGPYMQTVEDHANPGQFIWPEPPGGFPAFALAQQTRLLRELADYNAELDQAEGNANGKNTSPKNSGGDGELAPLLPGQAKRRRFIEINGVEIDTFARRNEINGSR